MTPGLTIRVLDFEYGIPNVEICASSDKFSSTNQLNLRLEELKSFANLMAGFPANLCDKRQYEFGRRGRPYGAYCGFHFLCVDSKGHVAVDICIEDDGGAFEAVVARFRLAFEAAGLDRFVKRLLEIEQERGGEATLPLAR